MSHVRPGLSWRKTCLRKQAMSDDNEGQDYKGEFVATGGRSEIRRPSELVPSKPLALRKQPLLLQSSVSP